MMSLSRLYAVLFLVSASVSASAQSLKLNDRGFFEARGVEVHCFDNPDGLRVFQKDRQLVSSGGVTVNGNTASRISSSLDLAGDRMEIRLGTDSLSVFLKARSSEQGLALSVFLPDPIPSGLCGRVCLEISFIGSEYIGKTCIVDGRPSVVSGEELKGRSIVLAPEDEQLRFAVRSDDEISIAGCDTGLKLSSHLPSGRIGDVLQWYLEPSNDSRWARQAELDYSRVGYAVGQKKTAVIVSDSKDTPESHLNVYRISEDGYRQQVLQTSVKYWGQKDAKSSYQVSDFSMLRESGIYCLEYGDVSSGAFIVSEDVFSDKWKGALKRMSNVLEGSACDSLDIVVRLSRLWELFRPEDDFSGNGVPDVIDLIRHFAMAVAGDGAASDALAADDRFRRISALAVSSRVLRGFDDDMSALLENQAAQMWNLYGKAQSDYRFAAAVQLWLTTGSAQCRSAVTSSLGRNLSGNDGFAAALPAYQLLDSRSKATMDGFRQDYSAKMKTQAASTPYGIPDLDTAGLLGWALDYYLLWLNFPGTTDSSALFSCLSAIYGRHTFPDESLLDSIPPACLPDFIALSMAAEKIAALPLN